MHRPNKPRSNRLPDPVNHNRRLDGSSVPLLRRDPRDGGLPGQTLDDDRHHVRTAGLHPRLHGRGCLLPDGAGRGRARGRGDRHRRGGQVRARLQTARLRHRVSQFILQGVGRGDGAAL